MNKGYQYNPTTTLKEILWSFIKLIRDLLHLLSPWVAEKFYSFCKKYLPEEEMPQKPALLKETEAGAEAALKPTPTAPAKEEAKVIAPSEEKPFVAQPYIDRGPLLPEHYGDDRIVALARDPHCIFVYWDLKGPRSREVMNYHKGPRYWSLRVRHSGKDAYLDLPINVDARNWYLWVADDRCYIIELGFSTPGGEFLTLISSNPVHTPRAGTSQEYAEYWGFIFREGKEITPEGVAWASPGGRLDSFHSLQGYEDWFEAHVPGSSTLQTQKKGQGK